MGPFALRSRLAALALCTGLLAPGAALAEEDDPAPDEGVEGEGGAEEDLSEAAADSPELYLAFQREMKPLPADEQLEGWQNYLREYPETPYRAEIEKRTVELRKRVEKEFDEDVAADEQAKQVEDARTQEMAFVEPYRFLPGNTRKRAFGSLFYGATTYFNYEAGVEWAFRRSFSAFAQVANRDVGSGGTLELGARYALVKDVRTGLLVSAAGLFRFGFDRGIYQQAPALDLGLEAYFHLGIAPPGTPVQIQLQAAGDFRFTPLEPRLRFGLNLAFRLSPRFHLFVESDGKMGFEQYYSTRTAGDETAVPLFFEGTLGGKIVLGPTGRAHLTVAVSAPYLWRYWIDWFPLGGGLAFTYYL
ncbi:hypothetical protein L6R50_08455 [Myxococcota bacterium]|nr:hypothetical protein [Myxococcota bacterium]